MLTIYGSDTESFFVSSGSYTINEDRTVSIIAEEAARLSDMDKEAATKALAAAAVRIKNPFSLDLSYSDIKKYQMRSTHVCLAN